jgi:rfaE bifunctional protein nucleotidyltransferase chain/domain
MGRIVRDHDELGRILRVFRKQGKSVVFTNGCFDILHVGHIRNLLDASSRGHYLVVGLNGDQAVRKLKGKGRPVQPVDERAEIIAAVEGVDYVTIFEEATADDVLRKLRPSAVAKGPEYTMDNLPEADTLREIGAELLVVGDPKDHSTATLVQKIGRVKGAGGGAGGRGSKKATASRARKKTTTRKAKSATASRSSRSKPARRPAKKKTTARKKSSGTSSKAKRAARPAGSR